MAKRCEVEDSSRWGGVGWEEKVRGERGEEGKVRVR